MGDIMAGGALLTLVLGSAVALPVTALLLWLFRRSVVRGMHRSAEDGGATPVQAPPRDAASSRAEPEGTLDEAASSLRMALAAYLFAGAVFVVVQTLGELWSLDAPVTFGTFGFIASPLALPLAFATFAVLPRGRLRTVVFVVHATLTATMLGWVAVRAGSLAEVLKAFGLAAVWAVPLIPLATRRLRAAGPLVLVFAVIGVASANALYGLAGEPMMGVAQSGVALWARLVGTAPPVEAIARGVTAVFDLVGGVIGVVLGRFVLMGVDARYRRKRFSDQTLFIDSVFVWFALRQAIALSLYGAQWLLVAPAALLAYALVIKLCLGAVRKAPPHGHRDLLLLRPFSLGRRSERLFDNLSKVWLRAGPVHMIAGPDLVVSTVAPTEFLAFLSGRMRRLFISDQAGLDDHLANLDAAEDPDGRYRVNQLFCSDYVWQAAMRALAARSDVILMDLRGFTAANQGCLYEVEVLIRGVGLRRVHFAVDATTDRAFLDEAVSRIWQQLPGDAPNRPYGGIASRIIWVDGKQKTLEMLLAALMQPLEPAPTVAA